MSRPLPSQVTENTELTNSCQAQIRAYQEPETEHLVSGLLKYSGLFRRAPKDRICRAVAEELAADNSEERESALSSRLEWLLGGSSLQEVQKLDPVRDSDRICHFLFSAFRVESRIAEMLAINRIVTWESAALFIRSTGEAETNPVARFFDTYALFANFFEWGEQSRRGREAVARINEIHGRYCIPNNGMKYVLLNAVFTWQDAIERIGHRPLTEVEQLGLFHGYLRLGRAMHIAELSHDHEQMRDWFERFNERQAVPTPLKTESFETITSRSLAGVASPELRHFMLLSARVGMADSYRSALGYATPTDPERAAVRAVFFTLGTAAEQLPSGAHLRSLMETPARRGYHTASELGVSARSEQLPRIADGQDNGGYPQNQKPVHANVPPATQRLPVVSWTQVREHTSEEDAWLVIDGHVYAVDSWLRHHPGGKDVLLRWAGKDASRAFTAAPHSEATRIFRLNYCIGRIAPE